MLYEKMKNLITPLFLFPVAALANPSPLSGMEDVGFLLMFIMVVIAVLPILFLYVAMKKSQDDSMSGLKLAFLIGPAAWLGVTGLFGMVYGYISMINMRLPAERPGNASILDPISIVMAMYFITLIVLSLYAYKKCKKQGRKA